MATPAKQPLSINSRGLAEAMGIDLRSVSRLVEKGVIAEAKIGRDKYDFIRAIRLAVSHYRAEAAGRQLTTSDLNPQEENAKLRRAQRQSKELELELMAGKLMRVEDVQTVMADHIKGLRAMVLSFPMLAQAEMPHLTGMDLETLRKVAQSLLMNNAVRMIETDGIHPELAEKVRGRLNKIEHDGDEE